MQSRPNLYSLIDMNRPDAVFEEVTTLASMIHPAVDTRFIDAVYRDVVRLFAGRYPGYKKSNTGYHDLFHTMDVMLASARLVHGAATAGTDFSPEEINQILLGAMMHDTGYIQQEGDARGTGARYTATHIERSIDFVTDYLRNEMNPRIDVEAVAQILRCTGLNVKIGEISFKSEKTRLLGFFLGTADLLGQMADRYYLEKLPILFKEFKEGGIPGYSSDLDLMEKTPGFYKVVMDRLKNELGNTRRFMKTHFHSRWNIPADLYDAAIEKNLDYLMKVVEEGRDYQKYLRRNVFLRAA